MVNATSCTVEFWMLLGGLVSSQQLEVRVQFIDVISALNGNGHPRAFDFDWANILTML